MPYRGSLKSHGRNPNFDPGYYNFVNPCKALRIYLLISAHSWGLGSEKEKTIAADQFGL